MGMRNLVDIISHSFRSFFPVLIIQSVISFKEKSSVNKYSNANGR